MSKNELTKEMIDAFIMHPDWPYMQKYIENHFENSVDIQTINTDNPSTTVHAEVIARKQVDESIKSLNKSFHNARASYGKTKPSYE